MTHDTDMLPNGYRPPQSPTEDTPLRPGFEIAAAMFPADLIARQAMGFDSPTWSIVVAAYLSTNPPVGSAGSAMREIGAMLVDVALGTAGTYAAQATSTVPSLVARAERVGGGGTMARFLLLVGSVSLVALLSTST